MRASYCFEDHKDTHFVTSLESPSFKKFLLCRSKELLSAMEPSLTTSTFALTEVWINLPTFT